MPNNICQEQNRDLHIRQLIAQRSLYDRSKTLRGLQAFLAIPVALGWSIGASVLPQLRGWAALWGLSVSVLDMCVFDFFQESWRRTAATIQELFDCEVLNIEWNEAQAGSRPAPEIISKYSNGKNDKFHNWYPIPIGELPESAARIVCQRSNLWWDAELRRTYSRWIAGILILMVLVALGIGFGRQMTLEHFVLALLAPLFPSVLWLIKEYRSQQKAIESSERLRVRSEAVWARLMAGKIEDLALEARALQDGMFDRRRSSPAIFNWVYKLLRSGHEKQMNEAAAELVREFKESSNPIGATVSGQ